MRILIETKDNLLNTNHFYDMEFVEPFDPYYFEEGPGSCDCNRGENVWLYSSETNEPYDTHECGSGRYQLRIRNKDTNDILYDEFLEEEEDQNDS